MAKIYGNTLATTMNPNRFQGGNGGSGGGITKEEVVDLINSSHSAVVFPRLREIETNLENKTDKDDVYLKDEIDLRLGDVDLALDRIIEIQNSFMPGGIPGEPNVPGGDA